MALLEGIAAATAGAVFAKLQTEIVPDGKLRRLIGGDEKKKAYDKALARAFELFKKKWPEHSSSLFDEKFLRGRAAGLLALNLLRGEAFGKELAERWAESITSDAQRQAKLASKGQEAAGDFFRILNAEVGKEALLHAETRFPHPVSRDFP